MRAERVGIRVDKQACFLKSTPEEGKVKRPRYTSFQVGITESILVTNGVTDRQSNLSKPTPATLTNITHFL